MSPSVDQLIRRLRSDAPTDRLQAARYFALHATPDQEAHLREALARENVHWIRVALKRALAKLSSDAGTPPLASSADSEDVPTRFAAEVYADALEEASAQLIHEVEPILGILRLAAEREISNFSSSNTRTHLDRLDGLLEAFSRLRSAAAAPKSEEFSLDETVQATVQETPIPEGVVVHRIGQQPCVVQGDSGLVALCLGNGLRNAIEATVAAGGDVSRFPITVSWGRTDVDCWIAVLDQGIGFKGNVERALDIGTTTKPGHLGMGLAIASQAADSLSGKLLLVPGPRGVRFEVRWPLSRSE